MKFAVACLIAGASAEIISGEEYQFMSFISNYQRSYGTREEYKFRLQTFKARVAEHERFNAVPGQTSRQGVNFLTDRTDDEIAHLLGYKE